MMPNVLAMSLGLIFVPYIHSAFLEEQTKLIPKENIFEFASSRNVQSRDYDDKRGFWDKRGYGDKRSDIFIERPIKETDCEQFPWLCLVNIAGHKDKVRESRNGLFTDKRGYGDKRGFWDKRGFGDRHDLLDKRIGRFYPFMFLPNSS